MVTEKLVIAFSVTESRTRNLDEELDLNGITSQYISNEERIFIEKEELNPTYFKFVKSTSWYISALKKIKSETPFKQQCKELIKLIGEVHPQSKFNRKENLWIAKPGGLSRGRDIAIFNSYNKILKYCGHHPDNDNEKRQKAWWVI
jgi:hypothetical protein